MIPLAEAEGLAVCPYQVFEGGLLTGKYSNVSAGEGLPAVSLVLLDLIILLAILSQQSQV